MNWRTLDDMDLAGKRVLIRVDINVPMENGRVTDATRIEKIVPTVKDILAAKGHPVLLAHFGRPKGAVKPEFSLNQLIPAFEEAFGSEVIFVADCIGPAAETAVKLLQGNQILLLENTRFYSEEEENNQDFAKKMANLGDVFCNDAFSAAHRAHASTEGLAHILPSCAGRLMEAELIALERALGNPQKPVAAVVGGAKVSTKLELLANLVEKVDHLIIGGGMANTFLAAEGYGVGNSLAEHDMTDTARAILKKAALVGCDIILPSDIVVAQEFKAHAAFSIHPADACPKDGMILDAGPLTTQRIEKVLEAARTLIWNGPLGAFEIEPFDAATNSAARKAAELTVKGGLVSVAGGGDTVAALNKSGAAEDFSYVSTAGGAFLEWMEGKTLPGVAALNSN